MLQFLLEQSPSNHFPTMGTEPQPMMTCFEPNDSDTFLIWLLLMGEGRELVWKEGRWWQLLSICTPSLWTMHWSLNLFILLESCEWEIAFISWTLQVKEWGPHYGDSSCYPNAHKEIRSDRRRFVLQTLRQRFACKWCIWKTCLLSFVSPLYTCPSRCALRWTKGFLKAFRI